MNNKNTQHAVSDCQSQVCGYRSLYMLISSLGLVIAAGILLAMLR